MTDLFTVWVGGVEVNGYYIALDKARELAEGYQDEGYDDVAVVKLNEGA
jgi:hypothetical protein